MILRRPSRRDATPLPRLLQEALWFGPAGQAGRLQYEISRDVTAGAAWEFLDAGPAPFSNRRGPLAGTPQGHFSTNYLNFLALNIRWKF
jgi:hypothetical protein